MKRTLLLLMTLLTMGVGGAWADTTSPSILAYPQAGKVYYISAYYSGGTTPTKSYLYYNGSALGVTTTAPSGEFAYLWLCAKASDGSYTFQNLSTGTYMGYKAMSSTAYSFNLGKLVTNTTCVPLYATGATKYMLVKHSASAFDQADNPYHNENFTSDYLFEEYAAQTLSHNQYYYIYCDNDDNGSPANDVRQYLYNGTATTIPVQTDESKVTLTDYAWRAIKSYDAENPDNDYFYFKNDTKYLGFHALSETQPTWKWHTNKADGFLTGRVMLWGYSATASGERYMLVKYNDGTQGYTSSGGYSTLKAYYKGNAVSTFGSNSDYQNSADWSQDFIFRVAPQTNVYRVAIKTDNVSTIAPVFTFDGIEYSGDCSIYVDGNNLPATKTISVKSANTKYIFQGFEAEDGTSLGKTINVSALTADKGVKAVFVELPFTVSTSFADATWYYLKVGYKWIGMDESTKTTELKDEKETGMNGMWAFVGNPIDGVKLMNFAAGSSYYANFAAPVQLLTNPSYALCQILNDATYGVYLYQDGCYVAQTGTGFGVANALSGYSVITVEAVDFKELALAFIEDYTADKAIGQYFGLDETVIQTYKNQITDNGCAAADYQQMVNFAAAVFTKKMPQTGYYRIKNYARKDGDNHYYISATTTALGNGSGSTDNTSASTVAYITRTATGKYTIKMQGGYLQAPNNEGNNSLSEEATEFTATINSVHPGWASFKAGSDDHPYLNMGEYNITGWDADESNNLGSFWTVEDAETVTIPLTYIESEGNSYATLYLPFGVTIADAEAYILTVDGSVATPTAIDAIPANTGVLLRATGNVSSVTATIDDDATATTTGNKLTGTCVDITDARSTGEYILSTKDGKLGFFRRASGRKIGANKGYLQLDDDISDDSGVKGVVLDWGGANVVSDLSADKGAQNGAVFNLAGQRVQQPTQGLYIMGGRKVLVK